MPAGVVAGAVVGAVAEVVSGGCPVDRDKERRVTRAVQDRAVAGGEEQCGRNDLLLAATMGLAACGAVPLGEGVAEGGRRM
ncbi:uncharacterized protein MONOS_15038 [Monocercomonoides exilis]|uniref:uncharacterized protein n=1 Tax=Monocercomonoides exilis TaxID=2049356 RepID=UPI00355A2DD9|nr:hypothetical protein MONOS_15038 [Monocercomonoides exilis]|eukprot:MONOS_15038.1-p1 / transcript=MONOS_15038.1 / gene=MONOS_15038 / organism=Monocercomonoides_exilis_PA203 / gene_product=unspecified product / transcript_product=unspecified product / location=Mono_scaffold01132:3145-3387(-) / protein_length=81 / sequence_SO=supercontig / SO=protein_coding / is_pseudo=false